MYHHFSFIPSLLLSGHLPCTQPPSCLSGNHPDIPAACHCSTSRSVGRPSNQPPACDPSTTPRGTPVPFRLSSLHHLLDSLIRVPRPEYLAAILSLARNEQG